MMTVDQDFPVPDLSGLSEDEKRQLLNVMKKAKEFEHREDMDFKMRQPLAGLLYKYTNVVKGWQHRWFQLDPQHGRLDYFEKEEYRKQKPRGTLHLAGAQISPSDEDEQTFSINAANGELYRLRAFDAKERQHWVTRLRATAEHHTDLLLQTQSGQNWDRGSLQGSVDSLNRSQESLRKSQSTKSKPHHSQQQYSTPAIKRSPVIITRRSQYKTVSSAPVSSAPLAETQFREVREMLTTVSHQQATLNYRIEDLPGTPACTDRDMLMLKATSAATLACLDQCLAILQQQTNHTLIQAETASKSTFYVPRGGSISPAESFLSVASHQPINDTSASRIPPLHDTYSRINHADEVEDKESYKDTDLQGVEEHKSIILHLLSQLKLGMDLTKVVLPTFILEKRSLLEMFADCMAHPDLFLCIPDQADPATRMLAVIEWYLTSFHAARQGCQAKKPYNPIIGEHFHCSWQLPKDHPCSQTTHISSDQSAATANYSSQSEPSVTGSADQSAHSETNSRINGDNQEAASEKLQTEQNVKTDSESIKKESNLNSSITSSDDEFDDLEDDLDKLRKHETKAEGQSEGQSGLGLYYCAEQVSHHPPISAFYFECPEKQMYMEASIWTKSKFLGMSIGVVMVGKVSLHLLSHGDETYEFSLPSAYARSILTVPWVELGDKITVNCPTTGYNASIIFHTKPFYGGKLHRVTCEIKNGNDIVTRAQGEWNQGFTFTDINGKTTKEINVEDLEVYRKRVRPVSQQSDFESRKLWGQVTHALNKNDVDQATEHKRFLEERQRQGEKHRRDTNTPYPTKFFHKEGERWVFNKSLKPGQHQPSI